METKILDKSDIEIIIKLITRESLDNGLIDNKLNDYLKAVTSFLEKNLNSNFKVYGVLEGEELVAMLTNTIIKRPIETISVLGHMYTHPDYRHRGLQSKQLLPFACIDNKQMGVVTMEVTDTSKERQVASHLFGTILGLSDNLPFYEKNLIGTYSLKPVLTDHILMIENFQNNSYYYTYSTSQGSIILDASLDISDMLPSSNADSHRIAYLNLYHRCSLKDSNAYAFYERVLLEQIIFRAQEMGVTTIRLNGANIQEPVLAELGFSKKANIMRGQNIIYSMNKTHVFQL